MKILLIYFTLKFAKTISFLFVMIFLTANYEANKFLNTKTFDNGERKTNLFLRPIRLEYVPEKVAIGTILYHAYYNLVFNLCYAKITLGKFYFFKIVDIRLIMRRFIYLLLGISKIIIEIIKIVMKINENNSLEEILFIKLYRPNDSKLILKINDNWEVNGKFELLKEKISIMLISRNTFLDEKTAKFVGKKIAKECENLVEIRNETKTYSAKFIKNKGITPHWAYPESVENNKQMGYQTDKQKSEANANYGRETIINQYSGKSKESTLLLGKAEEFKQISQEKKTSSIEQAVGALHHGYSKDTISKKYVATIEEIGRVENTIEVALNVVGVKNTKQLKQEILELAIKSMSD